MTERKDLTANWTTEAKDALSLADLAAFLVKDADLRSLSVSMQTGKVSIKVEAKR